MIYNLEKVEAISDGDETFVKSIVEVFLMETPEDLEQLNEAVGSEDFKNIYFFAHKLKPNVGLLGIDASYDHLVNIEKWGANHENLDKIKESFATAQLNLNTAINKIKSDFGF